MTREQAIVAVRNRYENHGGGDFCSGIVGALESLGLIKLDEPKTRDQKITDAMRASLGVFLSTAERARLDAAMGAAGLKIVEKD